jgi:hypothetical protein
VIERKDRWKKYKNKYRLLLEEEKHNNNYWTNKSRGKWEKKEKNNIWNG